MTLVDNATSLTGVLIFIILLYISYIQVKNIVRRIFLPLQYKNKEKIAKIRQQKIFFCYSRTHSENILSLSAFLNLITPVFIDSRSTSPGANWKAKIDHEIKNCSLFYLFWCRHSSRSDEVEREYKKAIRDRKKVIPILLDNTRLPMEIEEIHDLTETVGLCNKINDDLAINANIDRNYQKFDIGQIAPQIAERIGERASMNFDTYINKRISTSELYVMPIILRDIELRGGNDIGLVIEGPIAAGSVVVDTANVAVESVTESMGLGLHGKGGDGAG